VAQKSLDTRGKMLNIEYQVTFFPSCVPVSPIALYYPTLPRADYYSVAKVYLRILIITIIIIIIPLFSIYPLTGTT